MVNKFLLPNYTQGLQTNKSGGGGPGPGPVN
jgi:tubulin---tyrosine ligase